MFRITIKQVLLASLLVLQGCAGTPHKDEGETLAGAVFVADKTQLTLSKPPAEMIGKGLQTLVKGRHGNSQYEMLMQVELSQDKIVMVGTTTSGAQLFELQWIDNQPYRLTKSPLGKDIEVKYLLADFQLVHWPKDLLLNYLTGIDIVDKDNTRTLSRAGEPVILIEHQDGFIAFEHLERRYRLTIKVLDQWQN